MANHLTETFGALLGIILGACIGLGFGLWQAAALRRNEKRESNGEFKSNWSVLPGSGRRVAALVITLALVQVICPRLFVSGTEWWVSAGIAGGYGTLLFRQLRQRRIALGVAAPQHK